jgi:hypothetical protein
MADRPARRQQDAPDHAAPGVLCQSVRSLLHSSADAYMKRKRNRQMEMMNDAVRNFFSNQLSTRFSQMSFLCVCVCVCVCGGACVCG